jgi:hypothetical protein
MNVWVLVIMLHSGGIDILPEVYNSEEACIKASTELQKSNQIIGICFETKIQGIS